jgi:hypothetical protein
LEIVMARESDRTTEATTERSARSRIAAQRKIYVPQPTPDQQEYLENIKRETGREPVASLA